MWIYTYVLQSCKDEQLYVGVTKNLSKRINEHNSGEVVSTKAFIPFKCVYAEACINDGDAYAREKYLKSGMGRRYLKNRLKRFLTGKKDACTVRNSEKPSLSKK
jgi:putative endonuclease